jgi:hypothetical protein
MPGALQALRKQAGAATTSGAAAKAWQGAAKAAKAVVKGLF